jgi:hypothetical protein
MRSLQRPTEENLPTFTKQTRRKNQKVLLQKQATPHISYANTLKPQHSPFQTANPQTKQQATYQQQMQLPSTDIQELKIVMK